MTESSPNQKPVRNLVSRSCAEPSTTPFSTEASSRRKFGSKDHEMRFGTGTGNPVPIIKHQVRSSDKLSREA